MNFALPAGCNRLAVVVYYIYDKQLILLVIVSGIALTGGVPVEMASLLLTLIQTLIAMMDCRGGNIMANRLLVECGAHGVVEVLGNSDTIASAE